jgi:VCBS repeat protein
VTYGSGGDPAESVVVADVNGDGRADLLVSNNASSNIGVLLGSGDGTFQAVTTYCSGGYFAAAGTGGGLAVADVNGDGKPDLLMASCAANGIDGVVGVLLGNGDGTFQSAVTYGSGGSYPVSIAVADVNGDGKPDLAVTSPGSNTVGCFSAKATARSRRQSRMGLVTRIPRPWRLRM